MKPATVRLQVLGLSLLACLSTAVAPPAATQPRSELDRLRWLAGAWHGPWEHRRAEEHWMQPSGGVMVGMFRLTSEDELVVAELMTIERDEDHVIMFLRHFGDQLQSWEAAPLRFRLTELARRRAVFTNEDTDGEVRKLVYERTTDDTLVIEVGFVRDGRAQPATLRLSRVTGRKATAELKKPGG